jgi:DNA polymerase-4
MAETRKIIHLDLDAFFCAVEELRDPTLKGKPFAVGGRPEERGVVASCSYAARKFGVRSAMPMARALRLCPGLLIVSSHRKNYSDASKKVMAKLREVTQLIEQLSIDEAFLDVSDKEEYATVIARKLQAEIREDLNLPCSLGVATNKLIAKIANDVGKSNSKGDIPPNAITVVPPGKEEEFLAPLPVRALWGIGPKTAEKLAQLNIRTIGDLANTPEDSLARRFGKNGSDMARRARGVDNNPVVVSRPAKSLSQEITFSKDVADSVILREQFERQSKTLAKQLSNKNLTAATIIIKIRWPDFTTISRQLTLTQPTSDAKIILDTSWELFQREWNGQRPVRLLGVGVSGLGKPPRQLGLWDANTRRNVKLDAALSEVRKKFGDQVILRGSALSPQDSTEDESD